MLSGNQNFQSYIKIGLELAAVISAATYFIGFIAVNTYLLKYGHVDVNFFAPQFFLAGACIIFCLSVFYFMGIRQLIVVEADIAEEIDFFTRRNARYLPVLYLVIIIETWINVVFIFVLGCAFFPGLIFFDHGDAAVLVVVFVMFFILFPLDRFFNVDVFYPIFFRVLKIAMMLVAIYTYFKWLSLSGSRFHFFMSGAFLMLFVNVVVDRFRTTNRPQRHVYFAAFFAVFHLVGFSIYFGNSLYPWVKPSLGGGGPINISVSFNSEVNELLSLKSGDFLDVRVVSREGGHLIFVVEAGDVDETIHKVSMDKVLMIKTKKVEEKNENSLELYSGVWKKIRDTF